MNDKDDSSNNQHNTRPFLFSNFFHNKQNLGLIQIIIIVKIIFFTEISIALNNLFI